MMNHFSLDVLIPAHHETLSLPASITALQKIRANAPASLSTMRIFAGLSHWSGPEALEAAKDADVVLEISEKGKWRAIQALVEKSTADWIALVDAGVVWEENSLEILAPLFLQADVMGVNPRFQELKGGRLQKLIWSLESHLKILENKSGGPISLHGATIFYRRENLQQALKLLDGTEWLNDDVVVPLTLRSLFPEQRLVYTMETSVTDMFPSWDAPELQRRKRLLMGNIQWVHQFYLNHLRTAPVVALLAKRRLARMVWAWWFVSLGLASLFLLPTPFRMGALVVGAIALVFAAQRIKSVQRLLEAFWISFAFPLYFVRFTRQRALPTWK
jgi:cellulose synthase/poly-beta-1,6-N-acetylglucosamine synthase-like glycosyltransferase